MTEERCVCCGEIIPEGRMICVKCEQEAEEWKRLRESKN
jgi:RNA polymerase subunit RPABC4/transcription elongation factor Spt4